MSTPSIISAIEKLRFLLTKEEKWKWVGIVGFAVCTSVLEVVTATVIVIFAQVLTQPEAGLKYLGKLGFDHTLSPGRAVFYVALMCGCVYLIKNVIAACEVFYQNITIQKMNYHFKSKMLHRYAQADYGFYLTRNSSMGSNVVSGDVEQMFSSALIPLAAIFSESVVFINLKECK